MLRWQTKIIVTVDDERCMGDGPYRLLQLTERTGSLRQAAMSMGMSYSKAHAVVKRLERALQHRVLHSQTGGVCGGGAHLTEFGARLLEEYAAMQAAVEASAARAFDNFCNNLSLDVAGTAKPENSEPNLVSMER